MRHCVCLCLQANAEAARLGGGGVTGSPRGLSRPALVTLSVICAVSLAYAACPYQARAKVLIHLPPVIELGKIPFLSSSLFVILVSDAGRRVEPADPGFRMVPGRTHAPISAKFCEKFWHQTWKFWIDLSDLKVLDPLLRKPCLHTLPREKTLELWANLWKHDLCFSFVIVFLLK